MIEDEKTQGQLREDTTVLGAEDAESRTTPDRNSQVLSRMRDAIWRACLEQNLEGVYSAVLNSLRELGVSFDHCELQLFESNDLKAWHRSPERRRAAPSVMVALPFPHGVLAVGRHAEDVFSTSDIEAIEDMTEGLSEVFRRREEFRLMEQRNRELEGELAAYRQVSENLRKCNESFNIVIESLPYPFYVIDARTYRIVMANSAAKMGELTEESTCYEMTHRRSSPCEESEHPCPLETVRETRKPTSVEHVHFDAEGKPMNVEVHAFPIFDRGGDLSLLIEYSIDITDRKRTEEALRAMECVRVLAETAGAAAHEINQPLQAILTMASLLLRGSARGEPDRSRLERIIEQAGRIGEIIYKMKNVQQYATTPYMGAFDIVDFHRSCRKNEEEK